MKNLYRDIYENEISILEEEFISVNDNNNNLSSSNEYENKSESTIASIATSYTESVVSEKISENTWSSSRVNELKLRSLGQTSSETSKSIDSETVVSEQNSANTLSSSGLQNMQLSSTTTSEIIPGRSIDSEGWKAISEYEDFWKAWENGQDIEKIDMSINKIQDVFEKVHLPEPPLPKKQTGNDTIPVEIDNAKTRVPKPTPTQPSVTNDYPAILDNDNAHFNGHFQFQDDILSDEVSPNSTVQEFDDDELTEDSHNSYIDDAVDIEDIPEEFDDFGYDCDYDEY